MATAPMWLPVIEAASDWGAPPWEWAGGAPVLWYERYRVIRGIRIAIQNREKQYG